MTNPKLFLFAAIISLYGGLLSAQEKYVTILNKDTLNFSQDTLTLRAAGFRGQIRWQGSGNQHSWSNIWGEASDSLMVSLDSCGYYRYLVSEGTCDPLFSEITQVYVKDSCLFNPARFIGDYITILEHWNDGSRNSYYSVRVLKNTVLSSEGKLVLYIVGLFTGNKTSHYRISIDLKTQLISADPDNAMVVDSDLNGLGYGRLWFDDFTAPYVSTCNNYLRFTVTPILHDTGMWFGTYITYYIGPGAAFIRYDKKGLKDTPVRPVPLPETRPEQ